MDGIWRGPAWTLQPDGRKRNLVQTERIGPFLDGSVKLIEGRGYEEDGRVGFNALGIVYYDLAKQAYGLRSFAQGRGGDFKFEARPWLRVGSRSPAPVRYVATIKGNNCARRKHDLRPRSDQTFE